MVCQESSQTWDSPRNNGLCVCDETAQRGRPANLPAIIIWSQPCFLSSVPARTWLFSLPQFLVPATGPLTAHTFQCLESFPTPHAKPPPSSQLPFMPPKPTRLSPSKQTCLNKSSSANQVIWGPVAHFVPTSEIKPPYLHGCSIGLWSPQL